MATVIQRLELRRSAIRERLTAIGGLEGDAYTDEVRSEEAALQAEYGQLEQRHRSAVLAAEPNGQAPPAPEDGDGDSEAVEVRKLRGQVKLARHVAAALEERPVDGPEAEYNAALEVRGAGAFPLELLVPLEVRTTDTDSGQSQRPWLDRLFEDTAAMKVGVSFASVPPGVASFPVTTAGASAAQRGRSEDASDAAWTVGVTDLKPTRNTVRAVFSEEDALRLPSLERALQAGPVHGPDGRHRPGLFPGRRRGQ